MNVRGGSSKKRIWQRRTIRTSDENKAEHYWMLLAFILQAKCLNIPLIYEGGFENGFIFVCVFLVIMYHIV